MMPPFTASSSPSVSSLTPDVFAFALMVLSIVMPPLVGHSTA
jgi:hypothetical protein